MPLYSSLAAPVLSRLTLGGNISSSAWTTNGIGIAHSSRTITDTSSTGTVALGYTNVLGNNTIAAASAATFTDYATLQLGQPTAGTNVTMTNRWALELGGALRSTGFSLTGSQAQSLVDLAATWNTSGTPTAIKMNVTDTASAAGSLLMDLQVGGVSQFNIRKDGAITALTKMALGGITLGENGSGAITVRSAGIYGWSNDTTGAGAQDLSLFRDAADTLAQRRGTNAQAFRVYETFTDVSNYSRLSIGYSSAYTAFAIERQNAGTGSARGLVLNGGGVVLGIAQPASATYSWTFNSSGHFLAGTDNTYDIGASGANRPRNLFTAGTITSGGVITAATTSVPLITNSTNSNLYKLQFQDNGTSRGYLGADATYSFYVGSSAAAAQTRVVNATGVVENLAGITANASTAIPAGGTAGAGLMVSSTANFGVFFGSGAPTLSAAKGSLYLRSDGTTTNNRAYINTDGATTWTALTTAA